MATTTEMMTKDLSRTKELRERFIEYLEDIGDGLAAGRLAREGPEGTRPWMISGTSRAGERPASVPR